MSLRVCLVGLIAGGHSGVPRYAVKLIEGFEAVAAEYPEIALQLLTTPQGAEETVTSGLSRAFFPHGLGHSLGLTCHDVGCAEIKPKPNNPFLRNTSTISVDQVFTVEPGIYFIDMLLQPLRHGANAARVDWKLVDALATLGGIRIEDDVQVLDGGLRNFTRDHLA